VCYSWSPTEGYTTTRDRGDGGIEAMEIDGGDIGDGDRYRRLEIDIGDWR
jgi:hypothetical protein